MRFDGEKNIITLSLGEFVAIARRGISRTLPVDEEEPGVLTPSLRARRILGFDKTRVCLRHSFSALGYDFLLVGDADRIDGDTVYVIGSVTSSPEKPSAEEEREIRAAAFILGYIHAKNENLENISLETVYTNEKNGDVATRVEKVDMEKLEKFFMKCVERVCVFARPEVERVTKRLPTLRNLKFPFNAVRDGQSELVRAVYRNLARGTSLYACAPTGTGKTVSVIYPALRLLGEGKHDKVFYLTPKTTTAKVAADCIKLLADGGAAVRAIMLSSKERSCPKGLVCRTRANLCPLASCNRLAEATLALYDLKITVVDIADVSRVALEWGVCPYELALAYSELADVVICDINYLFDPRVYIRRFFTVGGRYSFLIDEAHNLADRAREMYSAEISTAELRAFYEDPLLPPAGGVRERSAEFEKALMKVLYPYLKDDIRKDQDGNEVGAVHLSEIPSELYGITDDYAKILGDALKSAYGAKDADADGRVVLLKDAYYGIERLRATLARFDSSYKLFLFLEGGNIRMKLFSIDTGNIIREMLSRGTGAVFFSATLSPLDYYRSVLGGDGTSDTLEVRSPFDPEALCVSIMDKISTRYSERGRTLPAVSRVIAATLSARRGKYMVFAPSFEYLEGIARDFRAKYPNIKVLEQRRDMTAREKSEFLDAFKDESDAYLVGFCVMGGIYSEGIDLTGKALIGAVVIGIGMPSLSYEREAMCEYYEEKYEAGKQYSYIYPGMNRVLQAAGRVIRREDDRGVIVLIDDRFDDPIYKKSIPSLWRGMEYVADAKELNERLKEFWREVDKSAL